MIEPCEKEKYFNSQLCEFRTLMGDKRFWANDRKIELAKKAITVQYLGGNFKNLQRVADNYLATMLEFTKRALLMGKFDKVTGT